GPEQSAQHADRGGLAAAVGAEESEDLAAADLQGKIAHDVLGAEALVELLHVDRERAHEPRPAPFTGPAPRPYEAIASQLRTGLAQHPCAALTSRPRGRRPPCARRSA